MEIVWIAFFVTALVVAAVAVLILRAGRDSATLRLVGRALLLMAAGTAVFPALLQPMGVRLWAATYGIFILLVTGFLTAVTAMGRCGDDEQQT